MDDNSKPAKKQKQNSIMPKALFCIPLGALIPWISIIIIELITDDGNNSAENTYKWAILIQFTWFTFFYNCGNIFTCRGDISAATTLRAIY